MRIKKPLLCSALSLMLIAGNAQINDSVFVVPDTLQPFSLADFYELILRHHPVARQAYQLPDTGRHFLY